MPNIIKVYDYSGTQITGTSKEPRSFSGLTNYQGGVKVHYKKGDIYFNKTTGHLYKCTKGAAQAKDSQWVYTSTMTLKKPGKLATITVSKSNDTTLTFTAKLKWIAEGWQSTSSQRATSAKLTCFVSVKGGDPIEVKSKSLSGASMSETTQWSVSMSSVLKKLYPKTDLTAVGVYFRISGSNEKGAATGNKSAVYKFKKPRVPTVGPIEYDPATGEISCKVKSDEGKDECQRVDTTIDVYTQNKQTGQTGSESVTTTTSLEVTKTYDVTNRAQLSNKHFAVMWVRAKARGIAGDSAWSKKQTMYVSAPQNVKISSGIRCDKNAVVVPIYVVPSSSGFPVTGVRLQALRDVQYDSSELIPAGAQWQDVGNEDDGQCKAISVDTADVIPSAGRFTWVRLKAWNNDEDLHHTFSAPVRLVELEKMVPTAADDDCTIASVEVGDDGESAIVEVVWNTDDSNETEVSWSTRENAWESTDQPETFVMADSEWSHSKSTTIGGNTYTKAATLNVVNLDSESRYWFAARRVREFDEETTTYGPLSIKVAASMSRGPSGVMLYVPDYVISGEPMVLSWDFDAADQQTAWNIRVMEGADKSPDDRIIANGSGAAWVSSVPWDSIEPKVSNGQIAIYGEITTNGGTMASETYSVPIVSRPSIALASTPDVTTQPVMLSVLSSTNETDLAVVVRSTGASVNSPSGYRTQADGDVVWSGVVMPDWVPADTYPSGSDLAQAKAALDAATQSYQTAETAYNALGQDYVDALVAYNNAASVVSDLEGNLSDARSALTEAQDALVSAQEYLATLEQGTEEYESALEAVDEAEQAVSDAEDAVEAIEAQLGTEQSPGPARQAMADALNDYEDAEDAYSSASLATEEAALEAAYAAYYAAEATYIPTVSSDKPYATTIQLPTGLDLIDRAAYVVNVVAIESTVGLRSEEQVGRFAIDLTHKAPQPPEDVEVEPFDVTDDDGFRTIGATISLKPSVRTVETDVYDVYRVTQDGSYLIASDLDDEATILDPYAPFGSAFLRYRVACRTANGDEEWRDYDYYLLGDMPLGRGFMRVDWGSEYVELQRSVSHSDAYRKGFEARKHLDGTVSGHWDEGTERTMTIDAAFMRGYESAGIESVRRLARYSGPCFIRTIDGTAYEADVEVGGISPSSGTIKVGVSMSATEVGLTEEFKALEVES